MSGKSSVRVAIREALLNLLASPFQTLIHIILGVAVGAGLVGFSASEASTIMRSWQAQESAGRSVFLVTGKTTTVPASLCDAANQISGVIGAGGILDRSPVKPALGTSGTIDLLRVTPSYAAAAWAERSPTAGPSVIVPAAVAHKYGLRVGSNVTFTSTLDAQPNKLMQSLKINWIPAYRSRIDGINDTILVVSPATGTVPQCIVSGSPSTRASLTASLQSWFGDGYDVSPFLNPSALVANPDIQFQQRPSIWSPLIGSFLLILVEAGTWFGRRADFALYRLLGLRRREIATLLWTEFTTATMVPFQIGALGALLLHSKLPLPVIEAVANDYVRAILLLILAPAVGLILLVRAPAVSAVKGL